MPYMPTCPGCGGYWLIAYDPLRKPGQLCAECERRAANPEGTNEPQAERVDLRTCCNTCQHWKPPDPSDRARSERHGLCCVIHDYDLAREPVPLDVKAFLDGRGSDLATTEDFGCALWAPREGT